MANIRGLHDSKPDDSMSDNEEGYLSYIFLHHMHCSSSSFAGGHRSGLAIQNPKGPSKSIKVFLYQNGFKLETSTFVVLTSDERAVFMKRMQEGFVPEELAKLLPSSSQDIAIELIQIDALFDASQFTQSSSQSLAATSKKSDGLYSGQGVSLSAESVPVRDVSVDSIAHPVVVDGATSVIQIRLPGGMKAVRKFNDQMRGEVLMQLVAALYPETGPSSIVLSSGFPPKPISEHDLLNKTLKELGVCNSVVNVSIQV